MHLLHTCYSMVAWVAKMPWKLLLWFFQDTTLIILRLMFLMVAIGLGVFILTSGALRDAPPWANFAVLFGIIILAMVVITLDMAFPRKKLETITAESDRRRSAGLRVCSIMLLP